MKLKKIVALVLAGAMSMSLVACGGSGDSQASTNAAPSETADEGTAAEETSGNYRVAFIARASADTFAAWLTREMISEAENYPDINLEYFSGEADDNKLNGILEDCITKEYDLVIVQVNDNAASVSRVEL